MDRASQVLSQSLPPGVRRTYAALSESSNVPISTLHHRNYGRREREELAQSQQYLTPEEEKALVKILLLTSNLGHPVRVKFMRSLAFGIARNRSSNKPIKLSGTNWPRAFQKRHPELKAIRVKAIDWKRHDSHIYDRVTEWFEVVGQVLQDVAILPENCYNMDETGVLLSMLGSVKIFVGKDDIRDYRGAGVKRTMVTAIECVTADGRSLLPLVIWPVSTHRSNWTTYPTPGWHYGHSENGYSDSKISLEWLTRVFDPQTRELANGKARILICDGFGTHETLEVLEFCFQNNIVLCRLPSYTSHKLQPCDVGVFAPLKTAYHDQVERLNRGGVEKVGKEHFTSLYKPARDRSLTKKNFIAGWAATGLFPFNSERVFRGIQKPLAELNVPRANNEVPRSSLQNGILQTPITLVTPMTTEALTSLKDLIEQDARTLDKMSKQRLQRHVQKIVSAAQISFTECVLLRDQNQFIYKINNEAKFRRSTRSIVLGKAKVMSYEDLEAARAKRDAKDKAIANKGQRGRKRKSPALQPEVEAEVEADSVLKDKVARVSETEPANAVGILLRAPVAKMY